CKTGLRPTTPDSTPIIGKTPVRHLWLNTGHGMLGWTLSCGSAELLAGLIAGEETSLDAEDYALQRFNR
ncbi:MAG: FAD-dependent oxidoreductase, partial [Gammaproteobacteria bacterium]